MRFSGIRSWLSRVSGTSFRQPKRRVLPHYLPLNIERLEGRVLLSSDHLTSFFDLADFRAATGAAAVAALESKGMLSGGASATYQTTDGKLTLSLGPGSPELYIGGDDWSSRMPGVEVAISGAENLNVAIAQPVYAVGFNIDASGDPQPTSMFAATLKSGDRVIGSTTFQPASDKPSFVGIQASESFDRLEIRELGGDDGKNEYFGQFYLGAVALPASSAVVTSASAVPPAPNSSATSTSANVTTTQAASLKLFSDRADFLMVSAGTVVSALESTGMIAGGTSATYRTTDGKITLSLGPGSPELYMGGDDWSPRMPGAEVAISGPENLNVAIAQPVYAVGFNIDASGDPQPTSMFAATLKSGDRVIGSTTFQPASDKPSFVGIQASESFDRLEIRELGGDDGKNEYFGQFYLGTVALPATVTPIATAPAVAPPPDSSAITATPAGTAPSGSPLPTIAVEDHEVSTTGLVAFSNRSEFLSTAGGGYVAALQNKGKIAGGANATYQTSDGQITVSLGPGSTELYMGHGGDEDWTSLLPGNEIAISGSENLNIAISQAASAFGFDLVKPSVGDGLMYSLFTVTLKDGDRSVGQFAFIPPIDTAVFVGVSSPEFFNRVEIRESIGSGENEYFGRFYLAGPNMNSGTNSVPLTPELAQRLAWENELRQTGDRFAVAGAIRQLRVQAGSIEGSVMNSKGARQARGDMTDWTPVEQRNLDRVTEMRAKADYFQSRLPDISRAEGERYALEQRAREDFPNKALLNSLSQDEGTRLAIAFANSPSEERAAFLRQVNPTPPTQPLQSDSEMAGSSVRKLPLILLAKDRTYDAAKVRENRDYDVDVQVIDAATKDSVSGATVTVKRGNSSAFAMTNQPLELFGLKIGQSFVRMDLKVGDSIEVSAPGYEKKTMTFSSDKQIQSYGTLDVTRFLGSSGNFIPVELDRKPQRLRLVVQGTTDKLMTVPVSAFPDSVERGELRCSKPQDVKVELIEYSKSQGPSLKLDVTANPRFTGKVNCDLSVSYDDVDWHTSAHLTLDINHGTVAVASPVILKIEFGGTSFMFPVQSVVRNGQQFSEFELRVQ